MTMRAYAVQRLLVLVPTMFGATLVLFILLRVLPGDVAAVILIGDQGGFATDEELADLRHRLGTDRPVLEQYVKWISGVVRLDLGTSLASGEPVVNSLARRFPVTLQLASLSIVVTALIGIPFGLVMALRRGTWIDYALRLVTISGQAVPTFVAATVLILLLVVGFNWLPPLEYVGFAKDPLRTFVQFFWPVLIMGYSGALVVARLTRSTMLDVLSQEYITTARAKGLGERSITLRHALKNASLPTFAYLGVLFVAALNGAVVIESIFSLPGVGSGLIDAISQRDYPMIEGMVLAILSIVLLSNLVIDLGYKWLDPRIRFE